MADSPTNPPVPIHARDYIGQIVVVETSGFYIFSGTLLAVGGEWLTIGDCDMHDHRESNSTREVYILDAVKYGIRKNRDRVLVRLEEVVAISRAEDVTRY